MFIAFALLEIGLHTATRLVMLSLTILYLGVAILALRGWRWALLLSVAVALLEVVWWAPALITNMWMFVTGHELYQDSPATIIVVLIEALLLVIPAAVLCIAYAVQWRQLRSRFVAGTNTSSQAIGTRRE
jgi:accessory gene regulator protein AgrB